MAVFSFRIDDGGPVADEQCLELPDALAARREATLFAAELLREQPDAFWDGPAWSVTVSSDTGAILFVLNLNGRDCRHERAQARGCGNVGRA
ncbi:MAG TPA: hypothetical protein VMT68_01395 [Caulobacteraceae bacterium]|nr:hypothetical protein [Caulobacteraceae bacterium]